MDRVVAYYRVSTVRQGQSSLGLEAQRKAVADLAAQRKAVIVAEFTEVESGKNNARPQLDKALHLARVSGSTLVIAKLDRLSRNAAFLLGLRDAKVRFIAADMPDANDLTVGILAVVAQAEREAISKRTKEALAAAKARGQKLGNPNGAAPFRRAAKGNVAAVEAIRSSADATAKDLLPIIEDVRAAGHSSLSAIAKELNNRMIQTPRGGIWTHAAVKRVLERVERTTD